MGFISLRVAKLKCSGKFLTLFLMLIRILLKLKKNLEVSLQGINRENLISKQSLLTNSTLGKTNTKI